MSLPEKINYKPLAQKKFDISDEVLFVIDGECLEIENENDKKLIHSFNISVLYSILKKLFEPIFKGFFACFKTSLLIPIFFYNKPSTIKYALVFMILSSLGGLQVFGSA